MTRVIVVSVLLAGLCIAMVHAQNVTRENVEGVTNFARVDTTIACAGATTPAAAAGLKKMGYASIINLRQASEPGADIDAAKAAAQAAGIHYVHLPFNAAMPDTKVVSDFLGAVADKSN